MSGLLIASLVVLLSDAPQDPPPGNPAAASPAPAWQADANPTRLFFAPTGRALARGDSYIGVYQVLMPFVQFGVTDRFSIGGGTPLFLGGVSDRPFWVTPKLQVVKTRSTAASVGVLHFVNMGDYSVGIAYAVATRGTTDAAVTAGVGYAYASADRSRAGAPVAMVGGEKRVSKRVKLVSENYWFGNVGLVGAGLRLMGDRMSTDFGMVAPLGVTGRLYLFPMVNVVFLVK